MNEPEAWSELAHLLYSAEPKATDVIFVHGFENLLDPLLERVAFLYASTGNPFIVINGAGEYEIGGRGAGYARTTLERTYGVPPDRIIETQPASHTLAEAREFIAAARSHDFCTATVVTIPPHLVRAFLTNLFVVQEEKAPITLKAQTIPVIDWQQGITIRGLVDTIENTSPLGRVFGECARIMEYRRRFESGDMNYGIATVTEGLHHLERER